MMTIEEEKDLAKVVEQVMKHINDKKCIEDKSNSFTSSFLFYWT